MTFLMLNRRRNRGRRGDRRVHIGRGFPRQRLETVKCTGNRRRLLVTLAGPTLRRHIETRRRRGRQLTLVRRRRRCRRRRGRISSDKIR